MQASKLARQRAKLRCILIAFLKLFGTEVLVKSTFEMNGFFFLYMFQEKTNQMMDKASDAMQSAKESCQEVHFISFFFLCYTYISI